MERQMTRKEFDLHLKSHDEPIPDLTGLVFINSTDSMKNILVNEPLKRNKGVRK